MSDFDPNTSPAPTHPPEDKKLIGGHPSDTSDVGAQLAQMQANRRNPGQAQATQTQETTPVTPSTPSEPQRVLLGNRSYTLQELAEKVENHDRFMSSQAPAAQVAVAVADASQNEDLSELMFTAPAKYTELVQDRALKALEKKMADKEAMNSARQKFYTEFKDLSAHEDMVEMYANKMSGELANLPPQEALSKLAKTVRERVASIKGTSQATEALPSGQAVTVGATAGPTVRGPAPAPKANDFMSQLQAVKKGRVKY